MELTVGHIGFGATALAYLGLALFYLLYGRWGKHGPFFLTAIGLTVAWALAALHGHDVIPHHADWTFLVQQLSMLAWALFLWHLLVSLEPYRARFPRRLRLGWVLIIALSEHAHWHQCAVELVPELRFGVHLMSGFG